MQCTHVFGSRCLLLLVLLLLLQVPKCKLTGVTALPTTKAVNAQVGSQAPDPLAGLLLD